MVNALLNCALCFILLFGGNQMEVKEYLMASQRAEVIIEGKSCYIDNLHELEECIGEMLKDSRWMPAYSVSLHTETIKEMQQGVWLKLEYNGTKWAEEMNFDTLLIKVEPTFQGFNIIRGNVGIYEGRCYYIGLVNHDMGELYNYLLQYQNNC